jgi:hypothetical protein
MLLAVDFDKDFIDEEGIAVALMLSFQSPSVERAEFYTPKANRFTTYRDTSLSQQIFDVTVTKIETIVEPDSIGNNIWRESVAFVGIYSPILSISGGLLGSTRKRVPPGDPLFIL